MGIMFFNKIDMANERDKIVFGEPFDEKKYGGGIRRFEITPEQVELLKQSNILNMEDKQNLAPTVRQFCEFLTRQDGEGWYIHGYAVSPYRGDFRISFEGAGKDGEATEQETADFIKTFGFADELCTGGERLYCWFD